MNISNAVTNRRMSYHAGNHCSFRLVFSDNRAKGHHHCFCGISVQTAARAIAIVNIAFCALDIAFAIYVYGGSNPMMTAVTCSVQCFYAFLNALILAAQKWRKPKLYLPYLAVQGFFMLLGCLYAVFVLCWTIYVLITEGNSKNGIMGITLCAFNCVLLPFCIWMYRLVWLAYKEASAGGKNIKSAY
uniref:Uncharacterized protein n=1 Tax=Globodera rostochiensis TaxID=31243 RepID=A0A914HMD8_GLORO